MKADAPRGAPARVARAVLPVLMTLALCGVYAYYVVRNLDSLIARDLRGLATLTAQIESEIETRRATLRSYARAGTEMDVVVPGADLPDEYRAFETLHREQAVAETAPSKPFDPRELVGQEVDVAGGKARLILHYTTYQSAGAQRVKHVAAGTVDLKQVVRPLFAQEFLSIFDLVLLAAPDGRIVYATPPPQPPPLPVPHAARGEAASAPRNASTGIVVTDLGALPERKGWGKWQPLEVKSLRGASRHTIVRVTDREFYLFTQPVRLVSEQCVDCATVPSSDPAQTKDGVTELLVCALVPKGAFRSQAVAMPAPVFTIVAGTLLLLACCWPFIRIIKLRERAPLKPVDVILAALAALVGGAILAIAVTDTHIFRRLCGMEDKQLAEYARSLRTSLRIDLLRVHALAEELRDALPPRSQTRDAFLSAPSGPNLWSHEAIHDYPYFRRAMWIHPDGQAVVFDATKKAPPPLDVRHRRFFEDLRANRWATVVEKGTAVNNRPPAVKPHRYIAEIVRTANAHETVFVVPPPEGVTGSAPAGPVLAVVAPLIHFVDPVVPPGFRFAVIDDRGTVLFHSKRERSLNENFFRETEDDRHLRSAFFARRDQQVNGRYWGVDHQMFVAPVESSPWVIVAMRDETLMRSVNTEMIATTALLLALHALLYALGFAVLAVLHPKYRAPWLWPHEDLKVDYVATVIALLIEVAALTLSALVLAPGALLLIGFAAPIRGLATAYLVMNSKREPRNSLKPQGYDFNWIVATTVSLVLTFLWCYAIRQGSVEPALAAKGGLWSALLIVLAVAGFAVSVVFRGLLQRFAGWLTDAGRGGREVATQLWRAKFDSETAGRPRWWLRAYELTGFLMLVVSAVLPALIFMKAATRIGLEARVKFSQLELADMIERRINLLESQSLRDARIAHDCAENDHVFQSAWTLAPRATRLLPEERPGPRNVTLPYDKTPSTDPSWFPGLLQSLLPRYAESSVAMRELHHDAASDEEWHWSRKSRLLTLHKKIALESEAAHRLYVTPVPEHALVIRSLVPRIVEVSEPLPPPDPDCEPTRFTANTIGGRPPEDVLSGRRMWRGFRAFLYLTVSGIAGFVLFSAIGFLARRVFLIDVQQPRWLRRDHPLEPPIGTNVFVQHKTEKPLADQAQFDVFPLKKVRDGEQTWTTFALKIDQTRAGDVLIPDFETGFDDASFSMAKLRLFEQLLEARRHTLVVLSRVTAAGVLARATGALRERWARVFDAFMLLDESLLVPENAVPAHDHGTERCGPFHGPDDVPERVLQRSWDDCSKEEKLALYQLARHGLASHRHARGVERLLGRHFICRMPALRVCCRPFHDFVVRAGERENLGALQLAARATAWERMRIPLAFLAIATLSLIVTTQQDIINSTSAILTGLAAGLPALIKLVAILTGKTSATGDGD